MTFSLFLHILSATLIGATAFGFPLIESFISKTSEKESALVLHRLSVRLSEFARIGGVISLLTGAYNWYEIGGTGGWLVVKLFLFAWFVISGIIVGRVFLRRRFEIISAGEVISEQVKSLNRKIYAYGVINLIVFVVIIFLAVVKPF